MIVWIKSGMVIGSTARTVHGIIFEHSDHMLYSRDLNKMVAGNRFPERFEARRC